jgi:hypothetical protein
LKKARVPERHQLPVARQVLQRFTFEDRVIATEVVEDTGFKYEKPAVDPAALGLRLLGELPNRVTFDRQSAEARGGRTAVTVASRPCCS